MQRYFSNNKQGNYLYLNEDDIYHIKKVMRMNNEDIVEIVYNGELFLSKIENINGNIKFKIKEEVKNCKTNLPFVTLIIPCLKENKIDLILQKATEMGVGKIVICPMERCMVKIEKSKTENKLNRWMRICKEASEQSKRNSIPDVEIIDKIEDLKKIEGHNFTCSTQEKINNIKKVLKNIKNCDKINLVIGPEGGISEKEELLLNKIGFESISLGNLIMRVESVPLFLMSIINYEYME